MSENSVLSSSMPFASIVELREYESTDVEGLSLDQADALRASITGLRGDYLGDSRWRLTAGHHVGFLRVGDLHVHVRPKVEVSSLLFLLSRATDRLAWRDDEVSTTTVEHPVDAMAHLLAEAVLRATRQGLLQGYQRRDEALSVVRGRWRVEDQVRAHQGRYLPAEVCYDDYTEDVDENRIVVTALRHIRKVLTDEGARRHVGRASSRFGEHIGSIPRREWSDLPVVAWQPLNAHYRSAVELARLVLNGSAVTHRAGATAAHGVLIDMNDLFERFVRRALREVLDGTVRKPTSRIAFDRDGLVGLEPDVLWLHDCGLRLVADVKYKKLAGGARHADLYQMHAYCAALRVPHGLLVYATGGGPTRHRLVDDRTTISVVGVDLDGSPSDIAASVDLVADEARALAASSGIPGRARRPEG